MLRDRVLVSGGFVLLLSWFALINGLDLLLIVLGAATLHELGHCLVLLAVGAKIRRLHISICGAVLETDVGHLSYSRELASVLAGPGMNLLCGAVLLATENSWCVTAAGAHLVLCVFNLLPLRPLDGGRALWILSTWLLGPEAGERITRTIGICTGIICGVGLLVFIVRTGGNLWLLPSSIGLLTAARGEHHQ